MFQNLENIAKYTRLHRQRNNEIDNINRSHCSKIKNFGDKAIFSMFFFGAITFTSCLIESRSDNPKNTMKYTNTTTAIGSTGIAISLLSGVIGSCQLYKKRDKLINKIEEDYKEQIQKLL